MIHAGCGCGSYKSEYSCRVDNPSDFDEYRLHGLTQYFSFHYITPKDSHYGMVATRSSVTTSAVRERLHAGRLLGNPAHHYMSQRIAADHIKARDIR